jgi:hypothetical protein
MPENVQGVDRVDASVAVDVAALATVPDVVAVRVLLVRVPDVRTVVVA